MSGCKALTINLQIRYLQLLNFYRKWRFPDVAQTQWRGVVTCNVISKKATVFISFQISLRPLRVYTYFNCVGVGVLFKYWYSCFRHRGSFGIFSVNFNSFVKELILWINKTRNYVDIVGRNSVFLTHGSEGTVMSKESRLKVYDCGAWFLRIVMSS